MGGSYKPHPVSAMYVVCPPPHGTLQLAPYQMYINISQCMTLINWKYYFNRAPQLELNKTIKSMTNWYKVVYIITRPEFLRQTEKART